MFDGRCADLTGIALVRLGGDVISQPQSHLPEHGRGVRQRFNAVSIDGLHLLDEAEKPIELDERVFGFVGAQCQARQVGDAGDVLGGQCPSLKIP